MGVGGGGERSLESPRSKGGGCWFVFNPSAGRWLDSARWPAPLSAGFIGLSERRWGKEGTICSFELIDNREAGMKTVRQSQHIGCWCRWVLGVSLSDLWVPTPPPRSSSSQKRERADQPETLPFLWYAYLSIKCSQFLELKNIHHSFCRVGQGGAST